MTRKAPLNNYAYGSFTALGPASALGSALKGFWSADDLTDGAVTTWTDSISSLAPTQGTAGFRPVRSATSFDSVYGGMFGGVTFDGSDDFLRTTTNVSLLPNGATAGEVWIVMNCQIPGATSGNKFMFAYGNTGTASRSFFRAQVGANRFSLQDGATSLVDARVIDMAGPHILRGTWSGTVMAGFIDGAISQPAMATISTLNTGTTAVVIGANIANVNPGNFIIRYILVTTILNSLQRLQLEGWIAARSGLLWRLSSSHPFRDRRP